MSRQRAAASTDNPCSITQVQRLCIPFSCIFPHSNEPLLQSLAKAILPCIASTRQSCHSCSKLLLLPCRPSLVQ